MNLNGSLLLFKLKSHKLVKIFNIAVMINENTTLFIAEPGETIDYWWLTSRENSVNHFNFLDKGTLVRFILT
jgi:hypothetical protein